MTLSPLLSAVVEPPQLDDAPRSSIPPLANTSTQTLPKNTHGALGLPTSLRSLRQPAPPPKTPKPPLSPKKEFLLVDDNAINLKILSAYLHKLGLSYQTATNGREAVDVFMRDPTQCKYIFMDISMPIMDGFEATRLIRAHEAELGVTAPTSIFALSGLASSSAQQEAFWSGVDLFLTKPVKLKELGSILKSRALLKDARD